MKHFILLTLFLSSIFAIELTWYNNYDLAIEKSKQTNKPIFLFMKSEYCNWCKKMEHRTLSNPDIQKILNKNFILLKLDKYNSKYPTSIKVRYVPSTFYLDSNGNYIDDPHEGYVNSKDLLLELNSIIEKID